MAATFERVAPNLKAKQLATDCLSRQERMLCLGLAHTNGKLPVTHVITLVDLRTDNQRHTRAISFHHFEIEEKLQHATHTISAHARVAAIGILNAHLSIGQLMGPERENTVRSNP